MDNQNIHKGLDNQTLRDFLAMGLVKNFKEQHDIVIPSIAHVNALDYSIKKLEAEIEAKQKLLVCLREKSALLQIVEMNGWEEFDVSDWTHKYAQREHYMSFIGTKEEHEMLINIIKIENQS